MKVKYWRRQVPVIAKQFTGANTGEISAFVGGNMRIVAPLIVEVHDHGKVLTVHAGEWLVAGPERGLSVWRHEDFKFNHYEDNRIYELLRGLGVEDIEGWLQSTLPLLISGVPEQALILFARLMSSGRYTSEDLKDMGLTRL